MSEIVGQDRVVAALTSAVRARRLAHGLLFIGPDSVGRETTARALARGLLCDKRGTVDAVVPVGCGNCRGCRRVQAGTHPDVHVVLSEAEAVARGVAEFDGKKARPSVEIKIDAIRDVCRLLPQRPYEGPTRVVIVVDGGKNGRRRRENIQSASGSTSQATTPAVPRAATTSSGRHQPALQPMSSSGRSRGGAQSSTRNRASRARNGAQRCRCRHARAW